ncbi:MAG: TetR/AcrR family transcriptional regulator [Actinomycetota bacterium]|nr:TetR/AcrR family transcriptional regulator [Actinomycetota bacterium]
MTSEETANRILEAARSCLLADGYSALTTRSVAESAGVPLSQIHYHFGSKDEMILELLRAENDKLLERQAEMFGRDLPLWKRWDIACDYLDEDLASGYVRVLQEMMAAGWSSDVIGKEVAGMLRGWNEVLTGLVDEAYEAGLAFGGLRVQDVVLLTSCAFLGAESMILLGLDDEEMPLRRALRRVGGMIKGVEEGTT